MLLDVEVAREPGEVVPVAQLPLHVGPAGLPRLDPDPAAVIVGLECPDLSGFAVVNAPDRLLEAVGVTKAEAGNNGQVLFLRELAGLEHGPDAGRVDGDRLFGENVFSGVDGGAQMAGPEVGRLAQEHDIDAALEYLPVGAEADELPLFWNIDLGGCLAFLQLFEAQAQAVLEGVAHGHELAIGVG